MIKISFIAPQRKVISFEIDGKVIRYFDEIWKDGVQIMPKDENLVNKLIRSRKQNLKMMAALILDTNKGENLEEYNSCKTEEDLAEFIRKDCKLKGLLEIK
jgi:hypothetical protein